MTFAMFSTSVISLTVVLLLISLASTLNASTTSKSSNIIDDKSVANPLEITKSLNSLDNNKLTNKSSSKSASSVDDTKSSSKSSKSSKKPEESNDYDEDYGDEDTDEDEAESGGGGGRNNTRQRPIHITKRIGTTYAWGRWEKWSRCTNSCVQIRKRQCIKRIQNATDSDGLEITFYPDLADQTTGCFGIMKKYRLCKDEKCKFSNRQMRNEQCSVYNRQQYKGKFYTWQGYEKEHNECELYCKPIDSDIFISMNQSVTDGTPCEKPAIYYTHYYRRKAVCVEGICKFDGSKNHLSISFCYDSPYLRVFVYLVVVSIIIGFINGKIYRHKAKYSDDQYYNVGRLQGTAW